MKLVYLSSHPIQYHAPLFRALATQCDFEAWFAHRQDAAGQAAAGYGVAFDWNVALLDGYAHRFLENVARVPSTQRYRGCDTPSLPHVLRDARPDAIVVGGWHLRTYRQALRAARALGIPAYVRTDSQWRPDEPAWRRVAKRLVYPLLLRDATGFLAAGVRSRDYLRDVGLPAAKVSIVPHTVDVARFGAATRATPDDAHATIAFVGRLLSHKAVDDLVDAMMHVPRARLVVIGDGPERGPLAEHAARRGVPITFAGFVNQAELPACLAGVDVLALPSRDDTWGLVVNEALAAGASAVVSDAVGCSADFAAARPAVLVHPVGDVAALATALHAALEARARGSDVAPRARLVESFSPSCVATRMIAACSGAPPR